MKINGRLRNDKEVPHARGNNEQKKDRQRSVSALAIDRRALYAISIFGLVVAIMDSHFQQSTHNRQSGQGESRVRAIICVIWLDDIFIFVVLCLRICLPFQSIVRHLSKTTINCHCCVVCTPENYLCVLPNLLDRENILAILFIHFSHLRLVNFFLFFFAIAVSALYRFCEWSRQVHGPVIFLFSFAFFFCCMFSFLGGRFAVVAFCILLTGGECKDYKKKRKEKNVVQCSERF